MEIAYESYMKNKAAVSGGDLDYLGREFYRSFAEGWKTNMTSDYAEMTYKTDEHAAPILRVNGIVNLTYYDVVLGNDLCVYPSYYEPWGYTPLEAVAFKVPCITTDLAGFGLWANKELGHDGEIEDGVKVIHRTDYNYSEVADAIKDTVAQFSAMTKQQVDSCRKKAEQLSKKALWSEFIKFYDEAYDMALRKAAERIEK